MPSAISTTRWVSPILLQEKSSFCGCPPSSLPTRPKESQGPELRCHHPTTQGSGSPAVSVPDCRTASTGAGKRPGPLLSLPGFPWAWEGAGFLSDDAVSLLAFPGLVSLPWLVFFPDIPRSVSSPPLFYFIYLFLDGVGEREKEKERNINVWLTLVCLLLGTWPATQACALTGNRTCNPLVCRPGLNPLSYMGQGFLPFMAAILAVSVPAPSGRMSPCLLPPPVVGGPLG